MAAIASATPVGIVGAGAMGAGIAQVAAAAGHPVLLFDAAPGAAAAGRGRILEQLDRLVAKGKLAADTARAIAERLVPVNGLRDLAPAGLVLEAVVESLEVKRGIFATLEAACRPDAILATNTSSLSVTEIAAGLERPERCAGMHFFNPAPLMKLVEIVSGLRTAPETASILHDTAAAWGKAPVHAANAPGFIVNRVARPFYGEALRLLEEGAADAATLDAILREAGGFAMGPFQVMDLVGLDVGLAVTESVWRGFNFDPRFAPSRLQREMVAAGRLGRKTGRGFYGHGTDAAPASPASLQPAAAPRRVSVGGDLGPATPLVERWRASGVSVTVTEGDGWVEADGLRVALSDGRPASARKLDAVFDLALDYASAKRIAVAFADGAPAAARTAAAGLFQAAGLEVSAVADVPGLVVLRTVAMLANEAAEAVRTGVCTPDAVETAMRLGVNYPKGPLAWADDVGPKRIVGVLDHLMQSYGERHRASPWLRRRAESGQRLSG